MKSIADMPAQRRTELLQLTLVLVLGLGAVAAAWGGYVFYGGYLADSLQDGLLRLARVTAVTIVDRKPERMRDILMDVARSAGLENAFVATPDGRAIADIRSGIRPGTRYSPVLLDQATLAEARRKGLAYGPTQNVAGFTFRSVYVTVGGGVLVFSAGEGYLDVLLDLRSKALRFVATVSVVVVAYLGLFVIGFRRYRKAAEEERRRRGLAMVGMMAAEVAHRIRNPLAIVLTSAETLQRKASKDGHEDELLTYIEEEVARINDSVEALLGIGRSEPPHRRTFSLCDALRQAFAESGIPKRFPNVEVNLSLPEDGECVIEGYEPGVVEALTNIMVNAAEAMEGKGRIDVSAAAHGDKCRVVVADNGPGIKARNINAVFDPFVTMKSDGSGLGLAIASRVFEQHAAKVEVKSGKSGTTFTISFDLFRSGKEED